MQTTKSKDVITMSTMASDDNVGPTYIRELPGRTAVGSHAGPSLLPPGLISMLVCIGIIISICIASR